MSNEKQFDFATIAVIIVSIALILGGFYLLNQSFTKKSDTSKSSFSVSNIVSSVSSVAPSTVVSSSSAKSVESSISSLSSSSSSVSVSSVSSSLSSSADSTSSSISTNSKVSTMSATEALVKVVETLDNGYRIEVIDTGYKDGKFWKIAKQFKISATIKLNKDKQYLLTGIKENDTGTTIGLIKESN